MTDTYYDPGTGEMVFLNGNVIERSALYLVEKIKDMYPTVDILCLDPARAQGITEAPFVVIENCKDGVQRKIFDCWALDDTVIERLYQADQTKFDGLKRLEKMEADQKRETERQFRELRDASNDVVEHVLKNKKSKYVAEDPRTGDTVTFFDDRPAQRQVKDL